MHNRWLLERAKKLAFVGGPDMAGGGGGDPSAGQATGGAPGGGASAAPDMSALQPMIQQMVQQTMMQNGGGAGGAGAASGAAGLKPKIDVNVEIMQIKNLLAHITDKLQIQIPATDMVATGDKLNAMASGQSTLSQPQGGGQAPAGGGGGQTSAIQPVSPVQPALPGGGKQAAYRPSSLASLSRQGRSLARRMAA